MTDKTQTQNLTRATLTDDHRLLPSYLRTLRDEVDARVTVHLRDLARSQAPPAAKLSLNTPVTVPSDGNARTIFDTVELDTDDMCDLSEHPTRIFFNTTGYYIVGSTHLLSGGAGPGPTEWSVGVAGSASGNRGVADPVSGTILGNSSAIMFQCTSPGSDYIEQFRAGFNSVFPTWTFLKATLWAYKVRDL